MPHLIVYVCQKKLKGGCATPARFGLVINVEAESLLVRAKYVQPAQ